MRLINTSTLEVEEFVCDRTLEYAILSHRWECRIWTETGFHDQRSKLESFEKLKQCCAKAKADSFKHVWIDSCCIDKTSSTELSEAINSMYLWYQKARRCYAYLADVSSSSALDTSNWFTRGWTLQELLAPSEVLFLDKSWKEMGTKTSLCQRISCRTRIPENILSGDNVEKASIAQRMSWASDRKTTRTEDLAYCLMGIFGVSMPLLYGEGEKAFTRLQEEIIRISDDHSLFAWRSPDHRSGLLATSPHAFIGCGSIVQTNVFGVPSPPIMSGTGIHLKLHFIGRGPRGLGMLILPCIARSEDKPLAIYVRDTTLAMERFERVFSEIFEWLDLSKFRTAQYPERKLWIRTGPSAPTGIPKYLGNGDSIAEQVYDSGMLAALMNIPGAKALFCAAQAGHQDLVWLLLTRSDLKTDSRDENGRSVLWHAVKNCHEVLVMILLSRYDTDLNSKDNEGQTPLWVAAECGNEMMVKLLLEKGADVKAWDDDSRTPLWAATVNGHGAVVKLLLENGADVEIKCSLSRTPLWWAAERDNENIVNLLLQSGAHVDTRSVFGQTPLSRAAQKGNLSMVKLLLKNNASTEAKDGDGKTPQWYAAKSRHEAVIQLLLEKEANTNREKKDERGQWHTTKRGCKIISKLLRRER
ncbi:hypothetical protein QQS21_004462 [Conoideocrella luteorostrata]|uniref:Heterokaryon incompatibility domain-containing protein n=1 Tax=Conoideocrella luteorostrata TaxID=1105319 RepID=A0AAJ0FVF1_9HYPO|nr:hypothetical protein QQS21_004462 [Conoideocrella luteorostrata]